MMHRKWSIFWMSSEKLGTGGRRASAVPNLMYSILIIAQNRGNFLGKKLLLYPNADEEAKTKQRAGEKAKKEMHPRQHAVELFGKKASAVPNR